MSHTRLLFALIGGAAALGSIAGCCFAWARTCWCCWDVENEEPL